MLLVTGALGNVGAEVVMALQRRGVAVRAADVNAAAIQQRFGPTVEAVPFDFAQPETFAPAFAGVERMFLMRPPAISDVKRFIFPAIDAAQRAGVQQVVFLSLIGVEKNHIVPHYKVEQHILSVGMPYTFLRPSFFMQNLSTTHRAEIRDRNEIFVPAGRGATSFIDVRDIAAVGALAMAENGHANQAYALTGSEALTYSQVATQLSEVLGRTITYRKPGLLRFLLRQRAQGTPLAFTLVMAGIYTTARLGLAGGVTAEVQRLLGRPPITFRQFAKDFQASWQPTTRSALAV
ncbi:MAG: SDR family oxidoreductase [Chloroflexaceae bacterium]|jgi:uncharacterized protein YbjT (DUF2867 family)|nr:SDR family oxidoreductase [Chloroflexaceae bacterium]